MTKDIKEFISSCGVCNRVKHKRFTPRAPLKPIVCSNVFEMVSIDVAGPLATTKAGNRFIIIVVDNFSKYIEAIAVPDFTAETTANFIVNKVFCKYGVINSIHSDQGVNFESELIKEVCMLLKIKKIKSISYHPQSNGQVERAIQTIKAMIFVLCRGTDWDVCLDQVIYGYNTAVNESTKHTPFEVVFGRIAKQIIDNTEVLPDSVPLAEGKVQEYIEKIHEQQRQISSDVPITGPPIIDLFRLLKSDYSIFRLKYRFLVDFLFIKIKK
jgi:transposase InsO family protein